uniref:CYTH domain-containing protein n=1 Tax=Plectus sambesii TaxID=2011161 RepID=A0A914XH26_9BILA
MFSQWNSVLLQTPNIIPSKRKMDRNVVVKARVDDYEKIEELIFHFTDSLGSVAVQEDVYFNVTQGRMKLRITYPNRNGQLIYYRRPNTAGPKISESRVTEVEDAVSLKNLLCLALDQLGAVQKRRRVYVKDKLRINLDEVEGVGCFVELAVALADMDTEKCGIEHVKRVMKALQIHKSSLVPFAYLDLIMENNNDI